MLSPDCNGSTQQVGSMTTQVRLRRREPVVQASSTFRWFVPQEHSASMQALKNGRHAISLMQGMLADAAAGW
jgi:hypothetical protein